MSFGSGLVLFGGMTTTNWHDPDPESLNLRANILIHASGAAAYRPVPVPTLGTWGLALLAALMLLVAFGARRNRLHG